MHFEPLQLHQNFSSDFRLNPLALFKTWMIGKSFVTGLALCFSVSSCATIIKGPTDTVTIVSEEIDSKIYVNGQLQGWNDAIVELKRGKKHRIVATKYGCTDVSLETGEAFDNTTWLDLFFTLGLFTFPVDLATGNAWKIHPTLYNLTPKC